MSLKVVFLGTSSAIPVPNRSFPSIAVLRKDEVIMIDCGEGTQRQMVLSRIGFGRKMKIIITHLHGDHVGGIIGLLQTMGMLKRLRPVEIYGPRGIKGFIRSAMQYLKIKLQYQLIIEEVREGLVLREKEYEVYATRASHLVKSYSYLLRERLRPGRFDVDKARKLGIPKGPLWHRIQSGEKIILNNKVIEPDMVLGPPRPGRILGFSGDTRPNGRLSEFFKGADLLVFEATYSERDFDKAVENMHSTSVEAAKIGAKARVKMLALTHLSARYDNPSIIEAEAIKHFSNVIVVKDLDVIEVPYPDSGEPFKRYQIKSFEGS